MSGIIILPEPIQAVESYETALKGNSKDIQLIKKLGAALVKMHDYDKASQHYENAIKLLNDHDLKFEHLELLVKVSNTSMCNYIIVVSDYYIQLFPQLKQYDKVDSTISFELNQLYNKGKDVNTLKRRVRFLLLQARSRELKNPTAGNTHLILTEARDIQTAVVKRIEIDSRGDLEEEKHQLSSVLCLLAKVKSMKEPAVAANLYSEALIHSPRDPNTLLALAKLYAQV